MIHTLTKEQRAEAQAELRQILKGHHEILTLAEWRGNTAFVRIFVTKNNKLIDLTFNAGVAMNEKTAHSHTQPYGFKRSGYGYGKEFDVVYSLGRTLYPKGHKHTVKNCHSNDHVNQGSIDNKFHRDGGYKFKQRSI